MGNQIIMDERERGDIRAAIHKAGLDVEIRTLEIGDYIVSPRCAVERKRGDDFVGSIFDQRLFLQLAKLRDAFPFPILLIEEPNLLFARKFVNPKAVFGALVFVSTRMGIPILPTIDAQDTAEKLRFIAELEAKAGWTNLGGLNDTSPSQKAPPSRGDQEYFIQGFVDIGYKRAVQLLDLFQTPEHVLHALELTNVECTKGGIPKKISGIMANVPGIGPKVVFRNQKLLHTSYRLAKKEKIKTKLP